MYKRQDIDASRLIFQDVAKGYQALRSGFINGERSQGSSTSREIKLAGGHKTSVDCFRQAQAHAVCEHHGMIRFVERILSEKFGKAGAGT